MRGKLVMVVVLVAVVAGVGFWYSQKGNSSPQVFPQSASQPQVEQKPVDQKTAAISLGSQILEKTQNPVKDNLPETNPFSRTETNPLKRIMKNPF